MNFFCEKFEDQCFFVRTNISPEAVNFLCDDIEKVTEGKLHLAGVGAGPGEVVKSMRQTRYSELPLSFWGSFILQGAVIAANKRHFNFELTDWSQLIQYLHYEEGDHFRSWHVDQMQSAFPENEIRKLTVVMGLSDPEDYEGGEFCFYLEYGGSQAFKLRKGEIVIFPAALKHRVRRVKSGVRKTLIGWYGGPPFK